MDLRSRLFLTLGALALAMGVATSAVAEEVAVCGGDLRDMLTPEEINLAARNVKIPVPPARYRVERISLHDAGPCAAGEGSSLSIEQDWYDQETGHWLRLGERPGSPLAPYLGNRQARLSRDGFGYQVTLDPFPGGPAPTGDAFDALLAAVRVLAPDFKESCAYRPAEGGWSDLAVLGMGDARASLPPGFKEVEMSLHFLAAPDAACEPSSPALGTELAFAATFGNDGGDTLTLSARDLPSGAVPDPGRMDARSATWSSNGRGFRIDSATPEDQPLGEDAVEKLAEAVDPNLSDACFLKASMMTREEIVALGFREPAVPTGWDLETSAWIREAVAESCVQTLTSRGTYHLTWQLLEKDPGGLGLAIEVTRAVAAPPTEPTELLVDETSLAWTDAQGTHYAVAGHVLTEEEGRTVPLEVLLAVARSLDPTLPAG